MTETTSANQGFDFEKLTVDQFLLTLRIIVGALAMGLLTFSLVIQLVIGPAEEKDELFTSLGLGFGLVMLVLHQVVGSIAQNRATKNLPEGEAAARGRLMAAYQTGRIVSCAMLEGAGFFNLIVYGFLSGEPTLLMMAGLLWMAILVKFPMRGPVEGWLEHKLREAREARSLGGDKR